MWIDQIIFYKIVLALEKLEMSSLQKIDRQVHIASILICSNDPKNSFKSASWFRRNDQNKTLVKKDFLEGKIESVFHCSIFDFGSYVDLQLETTQGLIKQYEYGPIKLDKKTQTLLQSQLSKSQVFPVTVLLNKNQKYQAQLSFSKSQSEILVFMLKIQGKSIEIQVKKPHKWNQLEEMFISKYQVPEGLNLNLGQNKIGFVKKLSKFNIYCHYGNYLNLTFKSEVQRNLFLLYILAVIEFNSILKAQKNSNQRRYSLRFSQINHLFASTDCFSDAMTPNSVTQNVLEDFRSIVFTPKPQFQRQVRERGFTSFQNFLGLEENHHRPSQKAIESIKTNETIKAIKQQQNEEETELKIKSINLNTKSHEFIFNWNKNRQKLKQHESKYKQKTCRIIQLSNKSKSKQKYYKHLSYQQLLERNKFLQQQSRRLLQENIRLKHQIQGLLSYQKGKSLNKEKEKSKGTFGIEKKTSLTNLLPQFIRQKILLKSGKHDGECQKSESKTSKWSQLSKASKHLSKISGTFAAKDSTPNSPGNYNFASYL